MHLLADLIGRPWALPCDPPQSFDCWELVCHVRGRAGLDTPDYSDHRSGLVSDMVLLHMADPKTEWNILLEPSPWCVVLMRRKHVGVYLPDRTVIHAQEGTGVRVDRLDLLSRLVTPIMFVETRHHAC